MHRRSLPLDSPHPSSSSTLDEERSVDPSATYRDVTEMNERSMRGLMPPPGSWLDPRRPPMTYLLKSAMSSFAHDRSTALFFYPGSGVVRSQNLIAGKGGKQSRRSKRRSHYIWGSVSNAKHGALRGSLFSFSLPWNISRPGGLTFAITTIGLESLTTTHRTNQDDPRFRA